MDLDTILAILDESNISYEVSTHGWGDIVLLEFLALLRGVSGAWQVQPGPKIAPPILAPWTGRQLSQDDVRSLAQLVRELDV